MIKEYIEDIKVGDTLYVVTPSRKMNIKIKECKVYDIQETVPYLYIYTKTKHKLNLVLSIDRLKINTKLYDGVDTFYTCEGYHQKVFYEEKRAIEYAIGLIDIKIIELKKQKDRLKNEQRI